MTLSEYLLRPGVTAAHLARQVGVSQSTIGRWADGSMDPSLGGLKRLHEATGGLVTPNDFLARAPERAA